MSYNLLHRLWLVRYLRQDRNSSSFEAEEWVFLTLMLQLITVLVQPVAVHTVF